jgi:AraC-like DNA-binding protein
MKLDDLTLSLTDLSHAVGYYDQSHFIKDFKDFSGLNPRQYFLEVHRMADLFTDSP